MSLISTEKARYSNLVKWEIAPELGYCKDVVIVNDPAGTLEIGTVLGKVTANGKYKRAVETAVDGSKVADAIVIEAKTILGSTDTKVQVLKQGPASISKQALIIDATYNDATKLGVVYTTLKNLDFQLLEQV